MFIINFISSQNTDGFYRFIFLQGSVTTQIRCGGLESRSIFGEDMDKCFAAYFLGHPACLGGAAVRASDFRSSGGGFDSQPGRNQST